MGRLWNILGVSEMMFENETCLSHDKVRGVALSYNIDITLLQNVIDTCIKEKLFESDGEKFWSNSLAKKSFLESRQRNQKQVSMEVRWESQKSVSDNSVITEITK